MKKETDLRCVVHILGKRNIVYHHIGYIWPICYRFAYFKYKKSLIDMYILVDRQSGLFIRGETNLTDLENWFVYNRKMIFDFFFTDKYKNCCERWEKLAKKHRFEIWERII